MSQATALDRRWIDWKSFDRASVRAFVNGQWWQNFELAERGHDQLVRVPLADLAFGIDLFGGEVAGAVEVDVGVEEVAAEDIDVAGEALGDMRVAELFANDAAVFAFHQGVVVGVARPGAGEPHA